MDSSYGDNPFSGILDIHVHHARNIHNICIYDNQDVYAKFSLTYNPDDSFSTRIVPGGGKNPDFNYNLLLKIDQPDAVLKCEIWMMSRAKTYMDDQLLGFTLVPISSLSGTGKVTRDYDLSSTDLFHSPAGTIKLSLSLDASTPLPDSYSELPPVESNVTTPELLVITKEEYSRVEFPDMNVVAEDQQMVSDFFAKNRSLLADGSFLHLGVVTTEDNEYEMTGNSSDDDEDDDGSIQNSGFQSSTMTSLSDDPNSAADSIEKKPTELQQEKEEAAMQQQIVDMYMRSMQQFTESLAKMKLPLEVDRGEEGKRKPKMEDKKKDGSRVFYGSRAFF